MCISFKMEYERSNCCFNWKITGRIIGWLGIALSIALGILFAPALGIFADKLFVVFILLLFVVNLVASIIWLIGISKGKSTFMLVSLFWWAMPLSLWIGLDCYYVIKGIYDMIDGKKSHHFNDEGLPHYITAFCAAYYFIALMTYKSMKEALKRRSEIPRLDVSYALPGDSKDMEDTKCLNLLEHA